MLSYEEGAMNILRCEPDDRFGECTPETFVARPVKSAVFTPYSVSMNLWDGWWGLYVADVRTVPGKRTRLPLALGVGRGLG